MILHLVLFTWKEGTTAEQVDALNKAMAELPGQIPELKDLKWGSDLGFREGNASWALAATFEDQAGWQAYQVHPAHQAVVKNLALPITASRNAIQISLP
ncbi:MAG: Dabb family protein [Bryobacteraceae bacterium]